MRLIITTGGTGRGNCDRMNQIREELRAMNYELRAYELRVTNYELRIASCELRAMNHTSFIQY